MSERLIVFRGDERVGVLMKEGLDGVLQYDVSSTGRPAPALSASLPVSTDPYPVDATAPFLEGLLPEGQLRTVMARRARVDELDVFGLLCAYGRDCAGAFSFVPDDEVDAWLAEPMGEIAWLENAALDKFITDMGNHPLGKARGIRYSLAGMQEKVLVVIGEDGRIGRPSGRIPTTHILKPLSGTRDSS